MGLRGALPKKLICIEQERVLTVFSYGLHIKTKWLVLNGLYFIRKQSAWITEGFCQVNWSLAFTKFSNGRHVKNSVLAVLCEVRCGITTQVEKSKKKWQLKISWNARVIWKQITPWQMRMGTDTHTSHVHGFNWTAAVNFEPKAVTFGVLAVEPAFLS